MPLKPTPPRASNTPLLDQQRANDDQRRAVNNEIQGLRDERRQAMTQRSAQRAMRRAVRNGDMQAIAAMSKSTGPAANFAGGGITDASQQQKIARDRAKNRADQQMQIRGAGLDANGKPNTQVNPGTREGAAAVEQGARNIGAGPQYDTARVEKAGVGDPAARNVLAPPVAASPSSVGSSATPPAGTAPVAPAGAKNGQPAVSPEIQRAREAVLALKGKWTTQEAANAEADANALAKDYSPSPDESQGPSVEEPVIDNSFTPEDIEKAKNLRGMSAKGKAASENEQRVIDQARQTLAAYDKSEGERMAMKEAMSTAAKEKEKVSLDRSAKAYEVQKKQTEDYFSDVLENEYYNASISPSAGRIGAIKGAFMQRRVNPDPPSPIDPTNTLFDESKPNFGLDKPVYQSVYGGSKMMRTGEEGREFVGNRQEPPGGFGMSYPGKPMYKSDAGTKELLNESAQQRLVDDWADSGIIDKVERNYPEIPKEMIERKMKSLESDRRLKAVIESSQQTATVLAGPLGSP